MTRDEYLSRLTEALDFMEEEARAAALDFYGEMLDDRMEDGLEEEEAVAAMEAPEDIARRIRQESKEGGKSADPDRFAAFASQTRKAAADAVKAAEKAARDVAAGADEMIKCAEKAARKAVAGADEIIQSTMQAVQKEIEKVKEGDYIRQQLSCPAADLTAVRLEGRDMPVRVRPSADDQAHLTYYSCPEDEYTARVEDGVLVLRHQGRGHKKGFHFSIFNFGQAKIQWKQSVPGVKLELPAGAAVDLTVETGNGSIRLSGLKALGQVNLSTSNARIDLEDSSCKSVTTHTSNGRLELKGLEIEKDLTGQTSNARIELAGCRGDNIRLASTNGRIQAQDTAAQRAMHLSTSNGSIQAEALDAADLALHTSNGSVTGTLPGPREGWQIESGTSNGSNSLPAHQAGEKPLAVFTSNGRIDIRFT